MENTKQLIRFLTRAQKVGYGAGDKARKIKEKDKSKTIIFKKGDWMCHDNYFGGEPYGGREVIFKDKKAIWIMVYYGFVDPSVENPGEIYTFLQKALSKPPEDVPLRGPKTLEDGNLKYENSWQGALASYSGKEIITRNGKRIYEATYLGGEVDRRGE